MNQHELLKPCPYCGWQAGNDLRDVVYPTATYGHWLDARDHSQGHIYNHEAKGASHQIWRVVCQENMGGCGASVTGTSRDFAMAHWNQRQQVLPRSDLDAVLDSYGAALGGKFNGATLLEYIDRYPQHRDALNRYSQVILASQPATGAAATLYSELVAMVSDLAHDDPGPDTEAGQTLSRLARIVSDYEHKVYRFDGPDPTPQQSAANLREAMDNPIPGYAELLPAQEVVPQELGELLARIHRDGGHYIQAHGLAKALQDADAKVVAWIARDDAQGTS